MLGVATGSLRRSQVRSQQTCQSRKSSLCIFLSPHSLQGVHSPKPTKKPTNKPNNEPTDTKPTQLPKPSTCDDNVVEINDDFFNVPGDEHTYLKVLENDVPKMKHKISNPQVPPQKEGSVSLLEVQNVSYSHPRMVFEERPSVCMRHAIHVGFVVKQR